MAHDAAAAWLNRNVADLDILLGILFLIKQFPLDPLWPLFDLDEGLPTASAIF